MEDSPIRLSAILICNKAWFTKGHKWKFPFAPLALQQILLKLTKTFLPRTIFLIGMRGMLVASPVRGACLSMPAVLQRQTI
jgi:hypothetical protein